MSQRNIKFRRKYIIENTHVRMIQSYQQYTITTKRTTQWSYTCYFSKKIAIFQYSLVQVQQMVNFWKHNISRMPTAGSTAANSPCLWIKVAPINRPPLLRPQASSLLLIYQVLSRSIIVIKNILLLIQHYSLRPAFSIFSTTS